MNGVISKTTYGVSTVVAEPGKSVAIAKQFALSNGLIAEGTLVAIDGNDLVVPYAEDKSTVIGSGDGTVKVFSGTLTGLKIQPRSLTVAAGAQILADDGFGRLKGDGIGMVDYETGEVEAEFDAAPANAAPVTAAYANRLIGVAAREVDTDAGDDVGPVLVMGVANKDALLVGEVAAGSDAVARLEALKIYTY